MGQSGVVDAPDGYCLPTKRNSLIQIRKRTSTLEPR
jgi:hypothetical protein